MGTPERQPGGPVSDPVYITAIMDVFTIILTCSKKNIHARGMTDMTTNAGNPEDGRVPLKGRRYDPPTVAVSAKRQT